MEARIIGQEVWWDHSCQEFRKKRLNLTKIPMEFRCPNCGDILTPKNRRNQKKVWVDNKKEERRKKVNMFLEGKPTKEEWDDFVDNNKELFGRTMVMLGYNKPIELSFYGGVCKKCWLDGFGRNGEQGKFWKKQLEKEEEKINRNSDKICLWINGELKLTTKVIELSPAVSKGRRTDE